MFPVSDAWKVKQDEMLAPEGFIEISYLLAPEGLQNSVFAYSGDSTGFDQSPSVTDTTMVYDRYATLEPNIWTLDGQSEIIPAGQANTGYVGSNFGTGWMEIEVEDGGDDLLAGLTITWSELHNEYATDFVVSFFRSGSQVKQVRVTGNTDVTSIVQVNTRNYNAIVIDILGWSLPNRRPRVERILMGYQVLFDKKDILSYSHKQKLCLSSGELPKNSIAFTLNNSDGRWNPTSPDGVERYLSDRQRMTVRYGMKVDGRMEWIKGGTFYLSEWSTPANGMEARFEARDVLEYMIDVPYTGIHSGTLHAIVSAAIAQAQLPSGASVVLDDVLKNYTADFESGKTIAEVLQMAANAACCVIYQDRDGVLHIERAGQPVSGYRIRKGVQYTWPEFSLYKPLAMVAVQGRDDIAHREWYSDVGETQTVDNEMISSDAQAEEVAEWVGGNLITRLTVGGEWRADPCLDVLDTVTVETKVGTVASVRLNELTLNFTGAFRGTFHGYIPAAGNAVEYYSGELFAGEVI